MTTRAVLSLLLVATMSCKGKKEPAPAPSPDSDTPAVEAPPTPVEPEKEPTTEEEPFVWQTESFADARILRYRVPGFSDLSLRQKQLVYYLCEAAHSGRDIIYDQKNKHNLTIRRTLEAVYEHYKGDRSSPAFKALEKYTKRVWFARGIHHDYSAAKYKPGFSKADWAQMVASIDAKHLPLADGEDAAALAKRLEPVLFDPEVMAKRVEKSQSGDPVMDSANNFYEGVTHKEVEAFYKPAFAKKDAEPPSYGLNSKLIKEGGKLVERPWKVGGMYGPAIEKMVGWLEKAQTVAENETQKQAIGKLIEYYRTGDLRKFDEYNVLWVKDVDSNVDFIHGFIEVYGDAIGMRATYESVVQIRDAEATKRIAAVGAQAQWFEDNAPLDPKHKKKEVVGISAKVVTVVCEAGDTSPTTPIGINLPNAAWIREKHGSKSVSLGNIIEAYDRASEASGVLEEFAASPEEVARAKAHGSLAKMLHVDMHEVIGHASGRLNPGVGTPKETLKSYASTLEEGRADLVALYYAMDPKLVELGLMPSLDVGRAEYDRYIRSGLMVQLSRLEAGQDVEESHMRNRQLIAAWVFEKGAKDKVVERISKDGKTYFVVRDYDKLRALFGQLLRELQRIKSEGDFKAGKALVETYGVKVDSALHEEVLKRYGALGVAPYPGFIQPKLHQVMRDDKVVDVMIEYPTDFAAQQLEHSKNYSFLPVTN